MSGDVDVFKYDRLSILLTTAVEVDGLLALGVRRSWVKGGHDNGWGSQESNETGEVHFVDLPISN